MAQEHRIGDVIDRLTHDLGLTDEERQRLLPSGKQTTFANRVHWARTFLVQAGVLDATKRAHFRNQRPGSEGPHWRAHRVSTTSTCLSSPSSFSFGNAAECLGYQRPSSAAEGSAMPEPPQLLTSFFGVPSDRSKRRFKEGTP